MEEVINMGVAQSWRTQSSRYRLAGSKCNECKNYYFPVTVVCSNCESDNLEVINFKGTGKLVEWTRVDEGASGFDHVVPYYFAIIQLDEGVRLSAQLVSVMDESKITDGMPVRMTFRKLMESTREGIIEYGFKAEPVNPI